MNRIRKKKQKNISLQLIFLFIFIALATTLLLEFIDFKKGEKSFFFTKIIPLKKTENRVSQFNKLFIQLLNRYKIPHDYFLDEENKYHFKLEIDQKRFDALIANINTISDKLKGIFKLTEIQGLAGKSIMLYEVKLNNKITHLVLITKIRPAKIPVLSKEDKIEKKTAKTEKKVVIEKNSQSTPKIAFIIDDIGAYDIGPLELKRLGIPITASVLPDSRRASEVVHWLREYRLNTMIHLPMQPTNSNGKRYNPKKVITKNSSDEQIRTLIQRAKQIVPFAEGLNNHEGSLVTTNRELMKKVMRVLKKEGLFFVDSRTIGGTVAYEIAKEFNIKSAYKDVFLDHIPTYSHSIAQIRKLVDVALQKGKALAIGHPLNSTIRAIKDSCSYIKKKGVEIVDVKELLN